MPLQGAGSAWGAADRSPHSSSSSSSGVSLRSSKARGLEKSRNAGRAEGVVRNNPSGRRPISVLMDFLSPVRRGFGWVAIESHY